MKSGSQNEKLFQNETIYPKWDSHIETIPKMKKQGKRQGAYAWLAAAPGEITL